MVFESTYIQNFPATSFKVRGYLGQYLKEKLTYDYEHCFLKKVQIVLKRNLHPIFLVCFTLTACFSRIAVICNAIIEDACCRQSSVDTFLAMRLASIQSLINIHTNLVSVKEILLNDTFLSAKVCFITFTRLSTQLNGQLFHRCLLIQTSSPPVTSCLSNQPERPLLSRCFKCRVRRERRLFFYHYVTILMKTQLNNGLFLITHAIKKILGCRPSTYILDVDWTYEKQNKKL